MRVRSLCTDKCDGVVPYIDGDRCTAVFRVILHLHGPICSLVLYLTNDGSNLAEVCYSTTVSSNKVYVAYYVRIVRS